DLGPVQQRCTLAHELHHLEFGRPCGSFCDDNEREVVEATARWLLPDLAPVGAALRTQDVEAAARDLGVTRQVLADRLCTLTEHEEIELAAMLTPATDAGDVRAAHGPRRHLRQVPPCVRNRMSDRPR
ncbi:MAG TPA: ImmA/IrrE family metallo-endopeptidase, partial [Jatrophihabitantaceae bacterium]|nr:ImmA/IrrE family metallo-endopeptidase [Jatrophihabitantaceae bacterium]